MAGLVYLLFPRGGNPSAPNTGGTFVEGVVGTPQFINPLLCEADADRDLCSLIFAGLTRFDDNGEVVPDIASTWNISENGLTYTFKLRQDVKWEDGTPVTADDVIFTTQLLQDKDFPGRADIGALWRTVQAQKVDPYTVQFTLRQPFAPFIDITTVGLLPQHILTGTPAADLRGLPFNLQPHGNAAWRVADTSSVSNRVASVSLEPSPNYTGPRAKISRIVFRYYSNSQALLEAFRNGDVDSMANLSPSDQQKAEAMDDVTAYSARISRYVGLFINLRKDSTSIALTDKNVRQALMFALDRQRVISDALGGRGMVAAAPFAPDTWAFDPNGRQYAFDPDRAKQLLRNAGFELTAIAPSNVEVWQKDGEAIDFTLLTPDSGVYPAIADSIAKQWRAVGIQVTVQPVRNLAAVFATARPLQFQMALVAVPLDGDPDPYAYWHQSRAANGQNYTGWDNKDASDLIEQARTTSDRAVRTDLYHRFQDIWTDDLPAIPLYYPTYRYYVSTRIKDVQLGPITFMSDRLRSLRNWTVSNGRAGIVPTPETK